MTMASFRFAIIAKGLDPHAADFEDRFFEAGCDDATIAFIKGNIVLQFEREARSFTHALASAIRDVSRAGATVVRVEPDDLVSLSDIAERIGTTRASISQHARGVRGRSFPAAIARLTTDMPLWDWVEVARWEYRRKRNLRTRRLVLHARLVQEVNRRIARYPRSLSVGMGKRFAEAARAA
jgi:hypothetical protein